jgi:molybdenum cofactor synthesis domain-containing protein
VPTSEAPTAVVITVSDSAHSGRRTDQSGPAVRDVLQQHGFEVVETSVVPDETIAIVYAIKSATERARLVVTTGGTGLGPRDVTPEATRSVCDRLVDGIAEAMRSQGAKHTQFAVLSRAVCGVRGNSLVLNLPGSPAAATQSLMAVVGVLPHALDLLRGKTEH